MCSATRKLQAGRPMRKRFLLVHNPIAGVEGRSLLGRVTKALEAQGATVVAAPSNGAGPNLSALDGGMFDAAIAAGGDGTFRALAKAIGERLPIGFLPMGTGNVLAYEIALPKKPDEVASVYLAGREITIEGARANGEPFFLMAGAGYDGEVINRLNTSLKRKIGKAAYVPPVLASLALGEPDLEILIDGSRHRAGWIVVTKARRYGGAFTISRDAGLQKPELRAVLFKSRSRALRVAQLQALAWGMLEHMKSVETIVCRRVEVRASTNAAVQIDGDPFGTTPLIVESGGPRARLIVPG